MWAVSVMMISCKTDRFNLSRVQENFINDCCFGEDFSHWLVGRLRDNGIDADVICMEDFGWVNRVKYQDTMYLMCITGYSDDFPNNPNYGEWQISFDPHRTLLQRLLRRQNATSEELLSKIKNVLLDVGFTEVTINQ